jgi:hypothetical protein
LFNGGIGRALMKSTLSGALQTQLPSGRQRNVRNHGGN